MDRQSHIVSFDDARRGVRQRRFSSASSRSRVHAGRIDDALVDFDMRSYGLDAATDRRSRHAGEDIGRRDRRGFDEAISFNRQDSGRVRDRGVSRSSARDDVRFGRARRSESDGLERLQQAEDVPDVAEEKALLFSRMSDKVASLRRSRAKEKADRRFAQQYGGSDRSSGAEPAGPRAAVYKTEMGTKHRRAARMQDAPDGCSSASSRSSSAHAGGGLPRWGVAGLVVSVCLVFSCAFLYGPAQQYYQEVRERDRLQAEYTAVQQRNDALQDEVDTLSTNEGVEDRAHEEFGWVKSDETAGSVTGIDVEKESDFRANIVSDSIDPPDTWYSGILDPLFGVS